jgi:integrase
MALGKITKSLVDTLPNGALVWDAGHRSVVVGFGVRRQLKDAFYLLRYRLNGHQRFITIGRHGSPWTPDTARAEARRLLGLVATRVDPAQERERQAETFDAEIKRYLAYKRPSMKPRSHYEVERHLTLYAKPLHRSPLGEIDRRTIASCLAGIETANGPTARNHVRSSLSAFFTWCIHEGLLDINPVTGTAEAAVNGSRERVLTEAELRAVWRALGNDQFGDIIRLLILTGQRREEIGGLRFSEIDWDRGLLVWPPARTKNNRLHELPMSPAVRAILERQPQRGRELIFGIGEGGFGGWTRAKARLDERSGVQGWTIHDARRTCATMMAERGIAEPWIIETILNHVSGHKASVAGVYNRARYLDQMRAALEAWADYIARLTT